MGYEIMAKAACIIYWPTSIECKQPLYVDC